MRNRKRQRPKSKGGNTFLRNSSYRFAGEIRARYSVTGKAGMQVSDKIKVWYDDKSRKWRRSPAGAAEGKTLVDAVIVERYYTINNCKYGLAGFRNYGMVVSLPCGKRIRVTS